MNKLILFFALILMVSCSSQKEDNSTVLINHLGYHSNAIKKLVFQTTSQSKPTKFEVLDLNGDVVFGGQFMEGDGQVDNWHKGKAFEGDFTQLDKAGQYLVRVQLKNKKFESSIFEIRSTALAPELLPLLLDGFKSQRCKDPYNSKDKKMSFYGDRNDTVDVSGGWYDASGEKGKYLSHLNFSNYMCPQQLPMMVWNLLETASYVQGNLGSEIEEEAAFGADYLVRVQDQIGYFYTTVFANWTKDPEQRQIAAYEGQDGRKNANYQAAFREGGGMAIAALARMSQLNIHGVFDSGKYLDAAIKGFEHLLENNLKYTNDGKENIIDDYCALLAAKELYKATNDKNYLDHARIRSRNLVNRLMVDDQMANWLRADDEGNRPYFHGAEAGLPIIALCQYVQIESDEKRFQEAIALISQLVDFEVTITKQVYNPYGYARQYVKAIDESSPRSSFFIPHQNETGYWWQGENARIASLATALLMARDILKVEKSIQIDEYANNQINWILGLNPYDMCMLEGAGHNNPIYKEGGVSYNYLGGVCNGITGGFTDETDIAFMPEPQKDDPAQRWRWSEQWLQHGGWLMPALALQAATNDIP